jgi:hypothetical protein
VYAPQTLAAPAPISVRLIGVLDADLLAAFGTLERGLVGAAGATVLVDVRDVHALGDDEMIALIDAVRNARAQGRDVRLDARSLAWKTQLKKNIAAHPPVTAELRSDVRRTVIIAHSQGKHKGR